jgi:mono/diheme cytochrome c family protein
VNRSRFLLLVAISGLLTSSLAGQTKAPQASRPDGQAATAPRDPAADAAGKSRRSTIDREAAARGYRFLTEKAYLGQDFDEQTFSEAWRYWPEPARTMAEQASVAERRRMAFARYGLTTRPGDDSGKPLQYVVDAAGNWVMNCFACHGGEVAGQVIPGLPNANFALETLTEETRAAKIQLGKPLSRMDVGSVFMPLGGNVGVTNAVMFGVALMGYRDAELNFQTDRSPPKMVHHDVDAIPWWHFRKRDMIYIDGFAAKGHRALMQFMLIRQNGPEKFREWESDFRDVYAYLESLEAPRYPFPVDSALATSGRQVFETHCARCHGQYGDEESYPQVVAPISEIGTDRVRFDALSESHRAGYGASWFAHFGEKPTVTQPRGYLAPPLDGIWASAPYFHNGSVPTLWHLLRPDQRPKVWNRINSEYDSTRVGLKVEEHAETPPDALRSNADRRRYYDTQRFGKSAAGHTYPSDLTEAEKVALLEYLKTL